LQLFKINVKGNRIYPNFGLQAPWYNCRRGTDIERKLKTVVLHYIQIYWCDVQSCIMRITKHCDYVILNKIMSETPQTVVLKCALRFLNTSGIATFSVIKNTPCLELCTAQYNKCGSRYHMFFVTTCLYSRSSIDLRALRVKSMCA